MTTDPTTAQPTVPTRKPARSWWDVAVRITAVVSLALSFALGYQYWDYSSCKARYDDRAARATEARTDAAERDRLALDRLWQALADTTDPAKVAPAQAGAYIRAAVQQFLLDRAEANRQRAENPPPALPSEVCR